LGHAKQFYCTNETSLLHTLTFLTGKLFHSPVLLESIPFQSPAASLDLCVPASPLPSARRPLAQARPQAAAAPRPDPATPSLRKVPPRVVGTRYQRGADLKISHTRYTPPSYSCAPHPPSINSPIALIPSAPPTPCRLAPPLATLYSGTATTINGHLSGSPIPCLVTKNPTKPQFGTVRT
jgi:hypothetical protein